MKRLWFKAKRYGYGWTPCTWEGWLVLAAYLAILAGAFFWFDHDSHSASDTVRPFVIFVFLLTALLLWIAHATGEPARWRWGDDDKDKTAR